MHGRQSCPFVGVATRGFYGWNLGKGLRLKNPEKKHGTWITPVKKEVLLVTIRFSVSTLLSPEVHLSKELGHVNVTKESTIIKPGLIFALVVTGTA